MRHLRRSHDVRSLNFFHRLPQVSSKMASTIRDLERLITVDGDIARLGEP